MLTGEERIYDAWMYFTIDYVFYVSDDVVFVKCLQQAKYYGTSRGSRSHGLYLHACSDQ